jgi:YtkA-like
MLSAASRCRRLALAVLLGVVWVAAQACGSSNGPTSETGSGSTADKPGAYCLTDPRAETYAPGLEETGAQGIFEIQLDSAKPAPPNEGNNEWTIELFDAQGKPVDGATFTIKPWMPDHGHGSSIVPTVTPEGNGKYGITLLNLFMPGLWQITFTVTANGKTDSVMFSFCVLG